MNKDFAVFFLVRAVELPKAYKTIIEDCKAKTIQYFGTRNIEDSDDIPGLHIKCEVTEDDAEEMRAMFPNYVGVDFIENVDGTFIVANL